MKGVCTSRKPRKPRKLKLRPGQRGQNWHSPEKVGDRKPATTNRTTSRMRPDATGEGRTQHILSSEEFTRGFVPPDNLWTGSCCAAFIYSLGARTGDSKTAVLIVDAAAIASGRILGP